MSVKLCKDCKHVGAGAYWLVCTNPAIPLDNLATGEHKMASSVRDYGRCGRDGALFESRVPAKPKVDPLLTEYPELQPLPGQRKASRWDRMLARLLRWVRS